MVPVRRELRRVVCYAVLLVSYGVVLAWSKVLRLVPRSGGTPQRGVMVTGTFYSRGWFLAHLRPLAGSGFGPVTVVADGALAEVPGVRPACPPKWLSQLAGRALSKLIMMIMSSAQRRPAWYMGFHVFPGALTALAVGRLFGRPVCYQMTGGPIEVAGGGAGAENPVLAGLGRGSRLLERLALAVLREFDLVVCRGRRAAGFLADRGVRHVEVLPGSVDMPPAEADGERTIDMVFVGRLTEIKQPALFVRIAARVRAARPDVAAVMVGDGPLRGELERLSAASGLTGQLRFAGQLADVSQVLRRSRVFVLTSRSEGLSLSMLEAMAHGVVPVVADVGELGDVVVDGREGWLIAADEIETFAERIAGVLNDDALRRRMSERARQTAADYASCERVAGRWREALTRPAGV